MQIGRAQIFTDEPEVTSENIIKVLRKSLPRHLANANRCEFLLNFEAGIQPKFGEKKFRKDIDFWCIDNLAHKITEFKLGFNWGSFNYLFSKSFKIQGFTSVNYDFDTSLTQIKNRSFYA